MNNLRSSLKAFYYSYILRNKRRASGVKAAQTRKHRAALKRLAEIDQELMLGDLGGGNNLTPTTGIAASSAAGSDSGSGA